MTSTQKIEYRRPTPGEFLALFRRSGLSLSQFILLSGRRREVLTRYMHDGNPSGFQPTMADIMILELAALDTANVDDMTDIANRYLTAIVPQR